MKLDEAYIEKLADILMQKDLTEISVEDGEQAITLRRDTLSVPVASVAPVSVAAPVVASTETAAPASAENHKGKPITSPMVGTFYAASSPDAEPFVKVGQSISKGEVVCIVEAMKLMNEIEAEFSGTITEICVENAQPVEFGQVLMYVE